MTEFTLLDFRGKVHFCGLIGCSKTPTRNLASDQLPVHPAHCLKRVSAVFFVALVARSSIRLVGQPFGQFGDTKTAAMYGLITPCCPTVTKSYGNMDRL
jgi:hypothetical protein